MFAEELQPYDYKLPYVLKGIFMVGWIDASHDYATGEVDHTLVDKLWEITKTQSVTIDLRVNTVRGIYPCPPCAQDINTQNIDGKPGFLGMSELWIPFRSNWYAAPSLVVHFIEKHSYLPPKVFLDAIDEFDIQSNIIAQTTYDKAVQEMAKL